MNQDINENVILDIRKTNIDTKSVINEITHRILEGEVDPCYVGVVLKKMVKIQEELMKIPEVKKAITEATIKYINGTLKGEKIFGANITYCATSTFYDFKECGHIVLDELYKIQEQVKEEIKQIEDELKLMIPTKDTMQTLDGKFGIKDTSKEIVIKTMPKLSWDTHDDIIKVIPPKKIQGMGLKFMKI